MPVQWHSNIIKYVFGVSIAHNVVRVVAQYTVLYKTVQCRTVMVSMARYDLRTFNSK